MNTGRRGFTLVEVLISLGLLLLLVGAAAAPLCLLAGRWRGRRDADEVMGVLRRARWLALTEGVEHGVTIARQGTGPWRALLLRREDGAWRRREASPPLPALGGVQTTGPSLKEFNPDGTSSGGSLILSTGDGRRWRFTFTTVTGRVRLRREGA